MSVIEIDYQEIISQKVDDEYLEKVDSEYMSLAEKYVEMNGTPKVAVGVAMYESGSFETLDDVAEELKVTRRGLYNAREKLGLEKEDPRGIHTL